MQLGGLGWEAEEADIGGQAQGAGLVKGPIIEDEEMEVVRRGGGHLLQEELEEGVERGQLQKEALTRRRFHGSIQIETLDPRGGRDHGLQAPSGDPATQDRQQATPTFVLSLDPTLGIARPVGLAHSVLELVG